MEKNTSKNNETTKKSLNSITISKVIKIFIILTIFVITIIFIKNKIINYNLFTQIVETNLKLFKSDNLYLEHISYNNVNTISEHTKIWIKGNHSKTERYSSDNSTNIIYKIIDSGETINPDAKKIIKIKPTSPITYSDIPYIATLDFSELSFSNKLKEFINLSDITVETIYNIPCYKVTHTFDNSYETTWFDVNTLYPIKSINNQTDTNYIISTCPLSENNLTIDTTGYDIIEIETASK